MLSRLLYLPVFLLVSLASAEARVFVSLAGSLLEADITAVNGDSVTLKRASDGQSLTVNRNTLCKEDNAYIARWAEAAAGPAPTAPDAAAPMSSTPPAPTPGGAFQKYNFAVQAQPAKDNRAPAGSTEKIFETTYTFQVSSKEVNRELQGAKAVILTLGRSVANAADVVMLQKMELDLALRAQGKVTLTTTPVQLVSSQEPRYGVRSLGYVLFILDAQGNVLLSESSPDGTGKDWKVLSAITTFPCLVDRDFKPRPGLETLAPYIRF